MYLGSVIPSDYEAELLSRSQTRGLGLLPIIPAVVPSLVTGLESLFGGKTNPTQNLQVVTPAGTLTYVYTGNPAATAQSFAYVANQWAQEGHLDWLTSIANTGSGPDWRNGGTSIFSGYGQGDRDWARQIVTAYSGSAALQNTNVASSPFPSPFAPTVTATPQQPTPTARTPQAASILGGVPTWALYGVGAVAVYGLFLRPAPRRRYAVNPSRKPARR